MLENPDPHPELDLLPISDALAKRVGVRRAGETGETLALCEFTILRPGPRSRPATWQQVKACFTALPGPQKYPKILTTHPCVFVKSIVRKITLEVRANPGMLLILLAPPGRAPVALTVQAQPLPSLSNETEIS